MAALSATAELPAVGVVVLEAEFGVLLELHAARRSPDNIRTAPMRINVPLWTMSNPSPVPLVAGPAGETTTP
jgi:hypothetical protein